MIAPPARVPAPAVDGPQLRDIHLPPDPSWWPPAPGWWLLGAVALALLSFAAWWWRRHRRVTRQRRQVLAEMSRLRERHRVDGDDARLFADTHQLLRRVARTQEPLAGQQRGAAWYATLARVRVDAATLQQVRQLDVVIYRPLPTVDIPPLVAAAEAWLRAATSRRWKPAQVPHA
ncbi:MAG: DUF4381 domain-containing protein [Rhodanobacter sp.]